MQNGGSPAAKVKTSFTANGEAVMPPEQCSPIPVVATAIVKEPLMYKP